MSGAIDHEHVHEFAEGLAEASVRASPNTLVDLAGVSYIDSAGIWAIHNFLEEFDSGRRLVLRGLSPRVMRVLEIAGLGHSERVTLIPSTRTKPSNGAGRAPSTGNHGVARSWSRAFPPSLEQLKFLREFVDSIAMEAGLDDERSFDLRVAASEAAANAIEHGSHAGNMAVDATLGKARLVVTISDRGSFKSRVHKDPKRAHRGMGIPLMLALTDEVAIGRLEGGGTRVSLTMHLGPRSSEEAPT